MTHSKKFCFKFCLHAYHHAAQAALMVQNAQDVQLKVEVLKHQTQKFLPEQKPQLATHLLNEIIALGPKTCHKGEFADPAAGRYTNIHLPRPDAIKFAPTRNSPFRPRLRG